MQGCGTHVQKAVSVVQTQCRLPQDRAAEAEAEARGAEKEAAAAQHRASGHRERLPGSRPPPRSTANPAEFSQPRARASACPDFLWGRSSAFTAGRV